MAAVISSTVRPDSTYGSIAVSQITSNRFDWTVTFAAKSYSYILYIIPFYDSGMGTSVTYYSSSDPGTYTFTGSSPNGVIFDIRFQEKSYVEKPTASVTTFTYNGEEKSITGASTGYSVKDDSNKATIPGDYTATYVLEDGYIWSDGTTADYTIDWKINKATLTNVSVAQNGSLAYNGSYQRPTVIAEATSQGSQTVSFSYSKDGISYSSTVPYIGPDADDYTIYYKASANYHNDATGSFVATIGRYSISSKSINLSKTSYVYNGSPCQPTATISGLTEGTDFSISYSDNTEAGTATVTATGTGNYKDTCTKTFSISRATLTSVTLSADSAQYDGNEHIPSIQSVTANGVIFTDSTTGWTVSYYRDSSTTSDFRTAGTITVKVTGTGNLTGTVSAAFVIASSQMTYSVSGFSGAYDRGNHGISVSVTTPSSGYEIKYGTELGVYDLDASPTIKDVGTLTVFYRITATGYDTITGSETVSITAKTVALTWGSTTSWVYDKTAHAPTCTAGVISGDSCTVTVSGAQTNVSDTPYTATATALSNANYALPSTGLTQTFSITAKTVTLTWGSTTSWVYDKTAHAPTCTANVISGDSCTVTVSGAQTNVGSSYTATATGLSNANYALPSTGTTQAFSITAKTVTLTWGSTTSWVYDKTAHAPTCTAGDVIEGDSCDVTVSGAQTNVGSSYTATATGLSNGNYALPTTGLTQAFSITAKTVTLTWGSTTSWVYDKTSHAPTCTADVISGDQCDVVVSGAQTNVGSSYTATASGLSNANYALPSTGTTQAFSITAKTVTLTWGSTTSWVYDKTAHAPTCTADVISGDQCDVVVSGAQTNVGSSYTATATGLSNANYALPSTGTTQAFSITAKTVTLTWGSTTSWVYDKTSHAPTCTADVISGDQCDVVVSGAQTNVGSSYTATASGLSNENYALPSTGLTQTFSITAKTVGLTWGSTTLEYNKTAQAPTCTASGVIGGDSCDVTVSGAETDVGDTYTATATGLSNTNYALPSTGLTQTFAITAKTVTLTWGSTTSWVYDKTSHAPTCTAGVISGDSCTVTVSGAQTNVGSSYTATATGLSNTNYALPTGGLTQLFDITKATLTVTANALSASVTYGSAAPGYALAYSGWKGDDGESLITTAPTASTGYTTSAAAGTEWGYTPQGGSSLTNYEYSYAVGTKFTVAKATAVDPTAATGLTYTGLPQSGVATSGSGVTLGGTQSATAVGNYSFTATPDSNHQWSDGTTSSKSYSWSIGKATAVEPTAATGLTYTGVAQSGVATSGTGVTLGGTQSATDYGTYSFTATPDSNHQWSDGTSSAKSYSWSIAKVTLTVTANALSSSVTYGSAAPGYALAYSGWKGDDSESLITTAPTASTGYTTSAAAGTEWGYTPQGGSSLTNYAYSYAVGTKFTVAKATAVDPTAATGLTYTGLPQSGVATSGSGVTLGGTQSAKDYGTYSFTATPDSNHQWSDGTSSAKSYSWGIGQATLTVTANALSSSVTYGGAAPGYALAYSGWKGDDGESLITTAPTASTGYTTSAAVGTEWGYTPVGGNELTNYAYSYAVGTKFTVIAAGEIGYSASGFDAAYDGNEHGITVTVSTPASGAVVKYGLSAGTYDLTTSPTLKNVGSMTVYFRITAPDFTTVEGSAVVKISKSTLTVTANALSSSVTYGSAAPGYVLAYSGWKGDDGESLITTAPTASTGYTTSAVAGTEWGYTPVGGNELTNYAYSYAVGTKFTVAKATAVDPTAATGLTYTGLPQSGVATSGSGVTLGGTQSAKDYGTYSFTATPDSNHQWSDGTSSAKSYSWGIGQATLTVTANALSSSVTYGGAAPGYALAYSGWKGDDGESLITTAPTASTGYTTTAAVGTEWGYTPKDGSALTNYAYSYAVGTKFTVVKATAVEPTVATGLTYTGLPQSGVATSGSGVTLGGTQSATAVGNYSFTATPDSIHQWSDGTTSTKTYTWGISQTSITGKTLVLSQTTYLYDGSEKRPSGTISGLVSGTDFTMSYANNVEIGTATATATGAGSYKDSTQSDFQIVDSTVEYPLAFVIGTGIASIWYKFGASSNYTETNKTKIVKKTEGTEWTAYAVPKTGYSYDETSQSNPATGVVRKKDNTFAPAATKTVDVSKNNYIKTIKRNGTTNDIAIRNRDFSFSEAKEAYADILEAAVLTVKGELFYNVNQGIPYFDTAFRSPIYLASWASKVKARIKDFDFVEEIESFTYEWNPDESKVSYSARIVTDEGIVSVEG